MKDPVGHLRIPAGFFISRFFISRHWRRRGQANYRRGSAERMTTFGILSSRRSPMPPWMEVLLNVIAFAGFIGVAKYHKPSDENAPKR